MEIQISNGGATLELINEELLFRGRRPAAQSVLHHTLEHWKDDVSIDFNRSTTGCLLLPNLSLPELKEDRQNLIDHIKRALPEVRADWQVQHLSLHNRIQSSFSLEREQKWLSQFPTNWQIIFGGIVSVTCAHLETNTWERDSIQFDFNLHKAIENLSEPYIQQIDMSEVPHSFYRSKKRLGLSIELEFSLPNSRMIFRVRYKTDSGEYTHKEIELDVVSDRVQKGVEAEPEDYALADRILLEATNPGEKILNIHLKEEDLPLSCAEKLDRQPGIQIRLEPHLTRR